MHLTRNLLFTFLLLNTCTAAVSQPSYRASVRRYGLEDGLPHRYVGSIIQDHRGFVWAATHGGVTRFDGRHFKVFNQASGLPSDRVEWVMEDANGYIWASREGANGWLSILEPLTGKVVPLEVYFRQWPLPEPVARWFKTPIAMADGSLLIGLHNPGGLLRFHPRFGWSRIPVPRGTEFRVHKIGAQQTIWGFWVPPDTSRTDLLKIDTLGRVLRRLQHRPGGWSFWDKKGAEDGSDHFFVMECKDYEKAVLWEIDEAGEHRKPHLFADNAKTKQYCRLDNSRIEVQFPYVLDSEGHILLDIRQHYPEIDPTQFCDFLQDGNGNLWFATTFGLVVVEIRKNHFRRLLYNEKAPGGRGYACRGLLEKNGQLLVNLEIPEQGRYRVDPQSGFAERLPGKCAIGIAPASDGNVWTECLFGEQSWQTLSLFKAGPDGQLLRQHLLQQKDFGFIFAILEESPQRVLLGHINGLTIYNPLDGSAAPWYDARFPEFNKANISWLGKDRSGQVWVCSEQGLFQMHPGGGVAARYWSGGTGEYHLPYDNIYHFYEDQAGVFWLGTSGGGLIRWDRKAPEGHQTQVIYRENGLLNGVVYAVYEDKNNHLWLPTDFGIAQLDKTSLQVRHTWLMADGLTHHEFNRTSHCRGADGTLYFGGLNGITAFNPDDFYQHNSTDEHQRTLALSDGSILKAGSDRLENCTAEILHHSQITIHPGDRYLQLEFALLEYFAPDKATYTWKLEGLEAGWESLTEPVLRLSSLPFGTHRLRIRAQAADGALAANELNIQLRVLAPFYLRWWFFLLVGLLLAASTWLWLWWRTREHRLEQERLEQEVTRQTATIRHQTEELSRLDQAKSRFFANISHEFRTPLTVILGMADQLKSTLGITSDHDVATMSLALIRRNGENLLQLVNQILDLSKLDSGLLKVHWQHGDIMVYLQYLTDSLYSIAQEREVRLVFYPETPELYMDYDPEKMQSIVINLLSNALKFTPRGGKVVFHAKFVPQLETPGHLQLIVQDTGKGIPEAELPHIFDRFHQVDDSTTRRGEGTGIGLAIVKELTSLLDGSITVESMEGKGATFTLLFPCIDRGEKAAVESGKPMEIRWTPPPISAAPSSSPLSQDSGAETSSTLPLLLIVEDNADVATYLCSLLGADYQIEWVADGQAGIERALEWVPDIIISDVMMPEKNGYELCETLKNDERTSHIPIILLTAKATQADKLAGLRTGADAYLEKPFHQEELFVRLQKLVELRAVLQARYSVESSTLVPVLTPGSEMSLEDRFLQRIREAVLRKLNDPELDIAYLCQVTHLSHAQVFRKLKALTGKNPTQYIRSLRLRQALELLQTTHLAISEVAYQVGFNDPNYFSRTFQKEYGTAPTDVRN